MSLRFVLFVWMLLVLTTTCAQSKSLRTVTNRDATPVATINVNDKTAAEENVIPSRMIHCRLFHVGASMLGLVYSSSSSSNSISSSTTDGITTTSVDVSHSMYTCISSPPSSSIDVYTVEFQRDADAASFVYPTWVDLPSTWIMKTPSLPHRIVVPAGQRPQRRRRRFLNGEEDPTSSSSTLLEASQEDTDVAPEDFTRMGRKTLLAVRVVTDTEQPDVTLEEMEAAIFGTAPHPSAVTLEQSDENSTTTTTATTAATVLQEDQNGASSSSNLIPYQSVAEQYKAATLGNLVYEPLRGPGYERGVLELNLSQAIRSDFQLAGQGIQAMGPSIVAATAARLGVTQVTNAVDHVIFCLPNDSLLAGTTAWTAFTYLYEPYRYVSLCSHGRKPFSESWIPKTKHLCDCCPIHATFTVVEFVIFLCTQ